MLSSVKSGDSRARWAHSLHARASHSIEKHWGKINKNEKKMWEVGCSIVSRRVDSTENAHVRSEQEQTVSSKVELSKIHEERESTEDGVYLYRPK